jgi:hypothetical protein
MIEKVGHIKNPLSIIAIFAGLAEISGTAILPFITPESQGKYVWFLMIFPMFLVTVFFVTLWMKPRVLYAPSDYTDESNFLKLMMAPATVAEVEAKTKMEAVELTFNAEPEPVPDARQNAPVTTSGSDIKPSHDAFPSTPSAQSAQDDLHRIYVQGENLAFSVLAQDYPNIRRNIVFNSGIKRHVFDGIAEGLLAIKLFEVKVISYPSKVYLRHSAAKFVKDVESANIDDPRNLELVLVVVYRDDRFVPEAAPTEIEYEGRKISLRYIQYAVTTTPAVYQ